MLSKTWTVLLAAIFLIVWPSHGLAAPLSGFPRQIKSFGPNVSRLTLGRGRYTFDTPAGGWARMPFTISMINERVKNFEAEIVRIETELRFSSPTRSAASLDEKQLDSKIQTTEHKRRKLEKKFNKFAPSPDESVRRQLTSLLFLRDYYRQILDLKKEREFLKKNPQKNVENAKKRQFGAPESKPAKGPLPKNGIAPKINRAA